MSIIVRQPERIPWKKTGLVVLAVVGGGGHDLRRDVRFEGGGRL